MIKLICIHLLLLLSLSAVAQDFTVRSLTAEPFDLTASKYERLDLNGRKCGILKVQCVLDGVTFAGNVMGDAEHHDGEYWVYLTPGTKMMAIHHPKVLPLKIDFLDYLSEPIRPAATYRLVLQIPDALYAAVVAAPVGSDGNGVLPQDGHGTSVEQIEVKGISFDMVFVDGGTFMMGADDADAFDDEKPRHEESVEPFYIGRTEVTRALWNAVMGKETYPRDEADLPADRMSWNDCQEFIQKLNDLTGRQFRVPSESEWEFASIGGNKTENHKYSGSSNADRVSWHEGNSGKRIHKVATRHPNELGIYDMSGNAWEWTSDLTSKNYKSPRDGGQSGGNRVIRGGAWNTKSRFCRSANRGDHIKGFHTVKAGLRLVLDM